MFAAGRPAQSPLLIGSVRTNLGHLEAAAGIAGLIKVVLALQHAQIPGHLHFERPNEHIPWSELPLRIPTQLLAWPSTDQPHRAGVSSFGFSGTNAHVILEQAPLRPQATDSTDSCGNGQPTASSPAAELKSPTPELLLLSARSPAALKELAARYQQQFRQQPQLAFTEVAYTAAVGRSHWEHRLALVADSCTQAADQLAAWLNGQPSRKNSGKVISVASRTKSPRWRPGPGTRAISVPAAAGPTLCAGGHVRLEALVAGTEQRRVPDRILPRPPGQQRTLPDKVSLPTYPFQRSGSGSKSRPTVSGPPLLRLLPSSGCTPWSTNGSTFACSETTFASELSSDQLPWLVDHQVHGQLLFPATAFAELLLTVAGQVQPAIRVLERIELLQSLALPPQGGVRRLQACVSSSDGLLKVLSQAAGGEPWTLHAQAWLKQDDALRPLAEVDLKQLQADCRQAVEVSRVYERCRQQGVHYGPSSKCCKEFGGDDRGRPWGESNCPTNWPARPCLIGCTRC